jgi:hypothetical protein
MRVIKPKNKVVPQEQKAKDRERAFREGIECCACSRQAELCLRGEWYCHRHRLLPVFLVEEKLEC